MFTIIKTCPPSAPISTRGFLFSHSVGVGCPTKTLDRFRVFPRHLIISWAPFYHLKILNRTLFFVEVRAAWELRMKFWDALQNSFSVCNQIIWDMKQETNIVTICGLAMSKKNLHRNMIKFAQHLRFNSFYIAFRLDAASRAENKRDIITSPPKAARTKLTTNQKVTKHSRSATE